MKTRSLEAEFFILCAWHGVHLGGASPLSKEVVLKDERNARAESRETV